MKLGVPWTQKGKGPQGSVPHHVAEAASVHERLDDLTRQLDRLAKITEGKLGQRTSEARQPRQEPRQESRQESRQEPRQEFRQEFRQPPAPVLDTEPEYEPPEPVPPPPPPSPRVRSAEPEVERYAGNRRLNRNPLKATYSATDLDRTLADITARQRMLDRDDRGSGAARQRADGPRERPRAKSDIDDPATSERAERPPAFSQPDREPRREPRPEPRPVPAQNLSGLEAQLRNITERIEALRQPNPVEDMVPVLRQELSEISRSIAEAMPRRAIEALEAEVRSLAERLDENRSAGVDGSALVNIEQGLADVHTALRSLTPAESLVGFQTAIQGLARKVDTLAAAHQDPAVLQQLESAITGLRTIVAHVASDDALAHLTDEVRGLAAKIDRTAGNVAPPDMLGNLEKRFSAMAKAIEESNAHGRQVPAQVESVVRGLTDKIDRLQFSHGDTIAFGQLEDRIAKLVEKLDASGARLSHLETIERGLADVLVHLEEQRRKGGISRAAEPAFEALKNDVEAVNATLNRVVDRLATIETGLRSGNNRNAATISTPPAAPPALPAAPQLDSLSPVAPQPAARAPQPAPAPVPMPAPMVSAPAVTAAPPPPARPAVPLSDRLAAAAQVVQRTPPREHQPIDPSLPPDHPLEPGSAGRPRGPSPADRIAASEAALGPAKPPVIPDPAGKSNFIAAARRAAQTAAQASDADADPADGTTGHGGSLRERLSGKMRSMLVGTSIVLLTLGAFRVATLLIDESGPDTSTPKIAQAPAKALPPKYSARASDPMPTGSIGSLAPAAPTTVPSASLVPATSPAAAAISSPASQAPPAKSQNDVTGSIPTTAATPPIKHVGTTAPTGEPDGLIAAATAGNPAAAYLLAERHIEGNGARRSYEDAAHWLERAAKHGLAPAQFRLGSLYEKGLGVKKDLNAARKLYAAAAEKGNAKAMHNLAVLYAEGIDGKPDYTVAVQWFRKAADRGVADSQYNLAVLCARGVGTDRNLTESYKWFALAADQGDKDSAKKRDEVAARLDAESLMAARLAVKTWAAKPQPAEATTVQAPPGGWERTVSTPSVNKHRSRTHAPLQIGRI